MGERRNRTPEAMGSNPISSTVVSCMKLLSKEKDSAGIHLPERDVSPSVADLFIEAAPPASSPVLLKLGTEPWGRSAVLIDPRVALGGGSNVGMLFQHSGGVKEAFSGRWFCLTSEIISGLGLDLKGVPGILWHGDGGLSWWVPSDQSEAWDEVERMRTVHEIMSL